MEQRAGELGFTGNYGKENSIGYRLFIRQSGGTLEVIGFSVKDLMVRNPIACDMDTKVSEVLGIMKEYDIGSVVVLERDSRKPVNIITHKDIISALYHSFLDRTVRELVELLEKEILITVEEDVSIFHVLKIFEERGIEHLPVVNKEGVLVGIVTGTDIMKTVPQFLFIDPLTGLENRRYLDFLNTRLIKQCRKNFYVLLIDIDNFKEVNDTYGHLIGDKVLRRVAEEITSAVRSYDNVVRFGGEEFVVLLYRVNREEATEIAERIRSRIEGIRLEGFPELKITVSIGVAPCRGSLFKALEEADAAMYQAKRKGKNRVEIAKEPA